MLSRLDLLLEDSRTVVYIHEKLVNRKELDINTSKLNETVSEKAENSQVFKVKIVSNDQKGKSEPASCFKCGKPGHIQRFCCSNFSNSNCSSSRRPNFNSDQIQ